MEAGRKAWGRGLGSRKFVIFFGFLEMAALSAGDVIMAKF